jgi:Ca2+-binding EF-hand superfamily protein
LQREETSALLNDNQVADFKAAFDLFDTDKDKKLTATDLRTIMKQLGTYFLDLWLLH